MQSTKWLRNVSAKRVGTTTSLVITISQSCETAGATVALKVEEITYIHAEAYPAGELKHGPLALATVAMPVVVAPNDTLIEKLKSNLQEVHARGGELFVFADADSHINSGEGLHVIRLPGLYSALSPTLRVMRLQLLAHQADTARGTDVNKPRNLAKSVTVQ